MPIDWTEDLAIGDPAIDADHRQILSILARLGDAVAAGQDSDDVTAILDALLACSKAHFAREERLMLIAGYPAYTMHKWAHETFLGELRHLMVRSEIGEIECTPRTVAFLGGWVADHVKGMDQELAGLLGGKTGRSGPLGRDSSPKP